MEQLLKQIVNNTKPKRSFSLCKTAWEKQHGFVIIDLSSKKHDGKYRSGLDDFTYQIKLIFSLKNGESS